MQTRLRATSAALVAMAAVLGACGGAPSTPTAAPPEVKPAATRATAPTAEQPRPTQVIAATSAPTPAPVTAAPAAVAQAAQPTAPPQPAAAKVAAKPVFIDFYADW